jgi:hypothetical protein
MRALSWKDPYASLMLHGKIETRKWKTNHRGPVLICCSKKPYSLHAIVNISGAEQTQRIRKVLGDEWPSVNGMAIAIGNLVDCRPMTPEDENACFVKYQPGLWCHIYKEVKPIKPFPFKGKQGWSNVGDALLEKLGFKVTYTILELSPEDLIRKMVKE